VTFLRQCIKHATEAIDFESYISEIYKQLEAQAVSLIHKPSNKWRFMS